MLFLRLLFNGLLFVEYLTSNCTKGLVGMKTLITILQRSALAFSAIVLLQASTNRATDERQRILEDYRTNFIGSTIEDFGWTGNLKGCKPGAVSAEAEKKALQRINYFRRMAGLSDNVVFDATLNEQTQAAALLMYANRRLTHAPTKSMKCYSEDAKTGASMSNLGQLTPDTEERVMVDLMEDPGKSNNTMGHRRWLLNSGAIKMGFGATPEYYGVNVTHGGNFNAPDVMPDKICWPPEGMVPYTLVFNKWSFGLPASIGEVDYSRATVSMKVNGSTVPIKIINRNDGYADPTLAWELTNLMSEFEFIYKSEGVGKKGIFEKEKLLENDITVNIRNVKVNEKNMSYTYVVLPIDVE